MTIDEGTMIQADASRKFVIFWATMFMTSTLGIVRLLSDFSVARDASWYFIVFSGLYFFFVGLNSLSVDGCLRAYKILRRLSIAGRLGNEIREGAINDATPLDIILSVRGGAMREWMKYLFLLPVIFYLLMYILAFMHLY